MVVKKNIPIVNEQMWELSREVEITQKNQIGRWNKKNTFEFTGRLEIVEKTWRYSNRNYPVWRKDVKILKKNEESLMTCEMIESQAERGETEKLNEAERQINK